MRQIRSFIIVIIIIIITISFMSEEAVGNLTTQFPWIQLIWVSMIFGVRVVGVDYFSYWDES